MNYGPLWIDLEGLELTPDEQTIVQHPNTGGLILFTKNFASRTQICELVAAIREYAHNDLIIAVDHEGGRIWRFEQGFTRPPSSKFFGEIYAKDKKNALTQIQQAGATIAAELLACGIDLSFAPVLDLEHGISTVIYERAYSRDPQIVIDCARAFIKGMQAQGMGAVGKHFPGHGGCSMDSHLINAVDTRSFKEIANDDLRPFAELAQELTGIMPAHVLYPNVDANLPGFSKFWLQDVLRKQLGFKGAIISDCLSMQGSGYAKDMADGALQALDAGCDMVITTQQARPYLLQVLDGFDWQMTKEQRQRIHRLAGNFSAVQMA